MDFILPQFVTLFHRHKNFVLRTGPRISNSDCLVTSVEVDNLLRVDKRTVEVIMHLCNVCSLFDILGANLAQLLLICSARSYNVEATLFLVGIIQIIEVITN